MLQFWLKGVNLQDTCYCFSNDCLEIKVIINFSTYLFKTHSMTKSLRLTFSFLFMSFSLSAQLPQIQSISRDEAPVAKYDKFEATIHLTATYANPYDYDEIIVKGVFICGLYYKGAAVNAC